MTIQSILHTQIHIVSRILRQPPDYLSPATGNKHLVGLDWQQRIIFTGRNRKDIVKSAGYKEVVTGTTI